MTVNVVIEVVQTNELLALRRREERGGAGTQAVRRFAGLTDEWARESGMPCSLSHRGCGGGGWGKGWDRQGDGRSFEGALLLPGEHTSCVGGEGVGAVAAGIG